MAPDRLGCLASISPHSGCRTGTTSGVHLMRPLHLRLRATCHLPKLQINILIFIICGVANQSRSHRFSLSHCASFTPCLIRINGTHTRCFCISCGKLGMWWHPPWPRSLPTATPVRLPVSSCHVAADAALLSLVLRNPAG